MPRSHVLFALGLPCALAFSASPVRAQEDYRAIVDAVRSCTSIADIAARVRCYDAAAIPAGVSGPQASASPPPVRPGFGAETLRQEREEQDRRLPESTSQRLTALAQREPGIYLLTLADGAQWQLVDAAPLSYDMPSRGETVTIARTSLGGFMFEHMGQRRLRIRRVR